MRRPVLALTVLLPAVAMACMAGPAEAALEDLPNTAVMQFRPKEQTVLIGDLFTVKVSVRTGDQYIDYVHMDANAALGHCYQLATARVWTEVLYTLCGDGRSYLDVARPDPAPALTGRVRVAKLTYEAVGLGTFYVDCSDAVLPDPCSVREATTGEDILRRTSAAKITVLPRHGG